MKALSRDPARRHETARELQLELEQYALENKLMISAMARAAEMESLFGNKVEAWREAAMAGRSLGEHLAAREDPDPPRDARDLPAVDPEIARRTAPSGADGGGGGGGGRRGSPRLMWRSASGPAPAPLPAAGPTVAPLPPADGIALERQPDTGRGAGQRRAPAGPHAPLPFAPGPPARGSARVRSPLRRAPEKKIWDPDSIYLP